jgi:TRAP transporter 4TM/12TM fusion protein
MAGIRISREGALFAGGLLFALVQLILPIYVYMIDLQLRSIHVALGISLALIAFPFGKAFRRETLSLWDGIVILVVLASNVNIFVKTMEIYNQPGVMTTLDLILGVALLLLIIEAARRTVGWVVPGMLIALLIYIALGSSMPGVWRMRGLSAHFLISSIYYSPLGIYGSVTGMSATFIALFIILGALLSVTGAGKTFIDLALALTGRFTGGPAKTAVVASALFGSISGSSVANVMVTGNYTIPLMKKYGYEPNFAGSVEAIASTGGGITPPIMSITAFMMAEFLNISYLKIIGYALIPCLLYYTGVFFGVHFKTVRLGLAALPREEVPLWKDILTASKMAGFLLPTGTLLYFIYTGDSLLDAGFYACAAAILVFFVTRIRQCGFTQLFGEIVRALSTGGVDVARLVPILVSMSVLVNMIGITGLAPKISGMILEVGVKNLYLSLLIATIVPCLLGTALPVVPTYLLSLSVLAPALLKLGVDEVAAHLFFIYWGVLGAVTPPTCEAAVVAAGISKGDWWKTGMNAVKLGIVAFFLPYFMVLNPALVGRAAPLDVALAAVTGFVGAISMAYGFFGWNDTRLNFLIRVSFLIGGVLMLFPNHWVSLVGLIISAIVLLCDRGMKPEPAASA